MITLGLGQGRSGITAQISLEELGRFRQHQLQMALAVELQRKLTALQLEHMASVTVIVAEPCPTGSQSGSVLTTMFSVALERSKTSGVKGS